MPGRLDRDNIEATRDIARICRRKNHQLPYGTRIEGRIASWDKQNNRTRRKPESTKRLPRGGLRDLVELVGGNLARGFWGDYGCGNARAPAGGEGRGGEGSRGVPACLTADARLGLHRPCRARRRDCFAICAVADAKEKHPYRTRKGPVGCVGRPGVVLLDRPVSDFTCGGIKLFLNKRAQVC